MHRREFICGVAGAVTGAAATLTLRAASAQQAAKVRRIAVLMGSSESDSSTYFPALLDGRVGGSRGMAPRPRRAHW
jgi:hypothetical protein